MAVAECLRFRVGRAQAGGRQRPRGAVLRFGWALTAGLFSPGAALVLGSTGPAGAVPPPVPTNLVVAQNGSDIVSSIAVPSNTFPSGISVAPDPTFVTITPDGHTAYVLNQSSNEVTPIDLTQTPNVAKTPIPVGTFPFGIAITPDGKTVVVANDVSSSVTLIDTATNTPRTTISLPGTSPFGVAITPDGHTAYVSDATGTDVIPIDLTTPSPTPGTPIAAGLAPEDMAITPDGKFLYAADVDGSDVTVIDTATNLAVATIPTGIGAQDVTITPDGKTAYVLNANAGGGPNPGSVSAIDVATQAVTATIPVGVAAFAIRSSTDGGTIYITEDNDNEVQEIDTATNQVTGAITGPAMNVPAGIAVVPDQAPTARFVVNPAVAGSPTSFDGSNSSAPLGTIASYRWDFGDGSTATTISPTATHVYATSGDYTTTLTVTDSGGTSTAFTFTGQTASNVGGPSAVTNRTFHVPASPPPPTTTTTTPSTTTTTTPAPTTTTTRPTGPGTIPVNQQTTAASGPGNPPLGSVSVPTGAARARGLKIAGLVLGALAVVGGAGAGILAWRGRRKECKTQGSSGSR